MIKTCVKQPVFDGFLETIQKDDFNQYLDIILFYSVLISDIEQWKKII